MKTYLFLITLQTEKLDYISISIIFWITQSQAKEKYFSAGIDTNLSVLDFNRKISNF